MKVLLFEYFMSSPGSCELEIEGMAMLYSAFLDFEMLGHDTYITLNRAKMGLAKHFSFKAIELSDAPDLESIIPEFDACLIIAPEDRGILEGLIDMVEGSVICLNQRARVVRLCYKDRLLELIPDLLPRSELGSAEGLSPPIVLKPVRGSGCKGIRIVDACNRVEEGFIAQELVRGLPASVSLITGRDGFSILSLNVQRIALRRNGFEYIGGFTPLMKRIDGLHQVIERVIEAVGADRGYLGIDLILGDRPYVVDVNPRLTTSYFGLRRVSKGNVMGSILDSALGRRVNPHRLDGYSLFGKVSAGKERFTSDLVSLPGKGIAIGYGKSVEECIRSYRRAVRSA